jgi:hypothetical protein
MVLLDLCKLFPGADDRIGYHANASNGQFPPTLLTSYPEEIALFKAMATK